MWGKIPLVFIDVFTAEKCYDFNTLPGRHKLQFFVGVAANILNKRQLRMI